MFGVVHLCPCLFYRTSRFLTYKQAIKRVILIDKFTLKTPVVVLIHNRHGGPVFVFQGSLIFAQWTEKCELNRISRQFCKLECYRFITLTRLDAILCDPLGKLILIDSSIARHFIR